MKINWIRRVTPLLLGLVLVAFAGCTSGPDETPAITTPPAAEQPAATQAPAQNEADPAPIAPVYDRLIAEPLTITFLHPETAHAPLTSDSIVLEAIRERTNVTLDFQLVPASDFDTRKSILLATDMMPDVIRGNPSDVRQFARTGMFLNLMDYAEYMPNFLNLINAPDRYADTRSMFMNGNLYAFFRLEHFRVGVAPQPMIRMDLLETHNIPVPATWDQLYDAFLQLKAQYPDMYIMSTRNGTNYLIGQIAFALGSGGFEGFNSSQGIYFEPELGQYLFGPIQDNFKVVIEFLHNMFRDGLLDPDYAVATRDITWERLSSGRLFFYYDNNTFAARTFNPALDQIMPGARFELLDPMVNSFGQTRALRYQRDWFADCIIISADVQRAADIVRFFDWCYTDEGVMLTNFGVEGVSYYMNNGVPQILPELLARHANASDVLSSVQAEIGAGQFHFTPFIDETWFMQTVEPLMAEHGNRINDLTDAGYIHFMRNDISLTFTEEEMERLTTWQTNVMTVFNSEIDRFIMGTRPLSEFDDFVAALVAQGAQDIQDLYNEAYQRMRG